MQVAFGNCRREVAVSKLENVANELVVGVDGVKEALGSAVKQVAAKSPHLEPALLIQAGDEAVSRCLDNAVLNRHLLVEKLRVAKILADILSGSSSCAGVILLAAFFAAKGSIILVKSQISL